MSRFRGQSPQSPIGKSMEQVSLHSLFGGFGDCPRNLIVGLCAIAVASLGCSPKPGLTAVEIVRRLTPSVVRIQVGGAAPASSAGGISGDGLGTGMIVDSQGHIVTNHHVLFPANGDRTPDRILVTLFDRRTLPGRIVGLDRRTDLAVLKVDASNLTPVTFAAPGDIEVGQEVIAIGFALDFRGPPTVTRGVVSALGRRIVDPTLVLPDAIQTDAGINPGNSGGPLANARAEVVGINSAIASRVPHVGFALSVSIVRPSVELLIRDGRIERAYLGIATIDSTVPVQGGPSPGEGVPISLVRPGSPAEQAGLRSKDILLKVAGEELTSGGDLLAILAKHRPGDRVAIEFTRGNERRSITATLGKHPES